MNDENNAEKSFDKASNNFKYILSNIKMLNC